MFRKLTEYWWLIWLLDYPCTWESGLGKCPVCFRNSIWKNPFSPDDPATIHCDDYIYGCGYSFWAMYYGEKQASRKDILFWRLRYWLGSPAHVEFDWDENGKPCHTLLQTHGGIIGSYRRVQFFIWWRRHDKTPLRTGENAE